MISLASGWPKLEELTIGEEVWVTDEQTEQSNGPLRWSSVLTRLALDAAIDQDLLAQLILDLPPTLSTLHIVMTNARFSPAFLDRLGPVSSHLHDFALVHHGSWYSLTASSLRLDHLLASCSAVERLTIPAWAVDELAASLISLPRLRELFLHGAYDQPYPHDQIVRLLN